MKTSFLYNLIKNNIEKRRLAKSPQDCLVRKEVYLFLNSNPWFSAVTDYSLQLCLYLKKQNCEILYGAEIGNTEMDKKCAEYNIPFLAIPIHRTNIFNFIISFFKVLRLLSSKNTNIKYFITFEGREHSLLIITRIIFPAWWHGKKIIRVRGQSQPIKASFFSKIVYKFYTDKIIFAAHCVLDRVQFSLPKKKYLVQLYCKDSEFKRIPLYEYNISNKFPLLRTTSLIFLVLGRFDSVKGHDSIVEAFLKCSIKDNIQLLFIGKSENLNSQDMFSHYQGYFENKIQDGNKYYLESGSKSFYIVDEKMKDLSVLLPNIHFGIIASLDSEVICRVGVEYMQNGVPCIYSNVGALPEVLAAFPEFKFEKGDTHELAAKMEYCYSIFQDSGKYNSLKDKVKAEGIDKYGLDNYQNIFV